VAGDIYALPFPDDEFDISIAHVVFCHLKEPEKALDELVRVTKRAGCVAVFDNARSPGGGGGWSSAYRPTMRQRLDEFEAGVRSMAGRKKLGFGDFSVGCYVPGWMEARGMTDVDVRTNERVYWVAPPYRSAGQQTDYRNLKERMKENRRGFRLDPDYVRELEAGGSSRALINRIRRYGIRNGRMYRKAVRDGTLAHAWSGPFWCIWGFKP
jgi:SAM-dependent methyltransferase